MENFYRRNINILYLWYPLIFPFILTWQVIQILLLESYGLSYSQISLVIIAFPIGLILFEIPTGIFADIFGRKKSLVVFTIFLSISLGILALTQNFYGFFISFLIAGIGVAFYSGAQQALFYESLKKLKEEQNYEFLNSRIQMYFIIATVITNFISPLLFEIHSKIPVWIGFGFSLIAIIITLFLTEIKIQKKHHFRILQEYKHTFISSLSIIKSSSVIIWLITFTALWGGVGIRAFAEILNQPLIFRNFSLDEYALIFALATIVQAVILFNFKIIKKFIQNKEFILSILIWSTGLILLMYSHIVLLIIIMGMLWCLGSILAIVVDVKINTLVKKDEVRATLLSTASIIFSLFAILFTLIYGILLESYTIEQVVIVCSISSLLIGFIFLAFKPKKL